MMHTLMMHTLINSVPATSTQAVGGSNPPALSQTQVVSSGGGSAPPVGQYGAPAGMGGSAPLHHSNRWPLK